MDHYDYNTLECRLKAAKKIISEFKSGKRYRKLQELRRKYAAYYNHAINDEKKRTEEAHAETKKVRMIWSGIVDDLETEYQAELAAASRELKKMEERALRAERQRDEALDKLTEVRRQYYETASELEDEKGKNQKLRAQLNRDFENSSIPSSKSRKPKKISNSREKTGRKPGAQPGHEGHHRKRQKPTSSRKLPPPQEVLDDPDFRLTGRTKSKQMVSIEMRLVVNELIAYMAKNLTARKSRTLRKGTMKQSQRRVENTVIHRQAITTKKYITFTGEWNTVIITCFSFMISVCPPLIMRPNGFSLSTWGLNSNTDVNILFFYAD